MTLDQASQGGEYVVVAVRGSDRVRRRLLEIGFTPSCRVYVGKVASRGGTVLGGLRGFAIALRREAARRIEVRAV